MKLKALSLVAALVSASFFSVSASAAPLVCKPGNKPVTVKSIGPAKSGAVMVKYTVNATKDERGIQYTTKEVKAKKLAAGVEFCMDEAEL